MGSDSPTTDSLELGKLLWSTELAKSFLGKRGEPKGTQKDFCKQAGFYFKESRSPHVGDGSQRTSLGRRLQEVCGTRSPCLWCAVNCYWLCK